MSYMKYSVFTINGFHFMHVLHAVEKTAMLHVCVCVCVHACAMRACGVCMCMCMCVCVCVCGVCVFHTTMFIGTVQFCVIVGVRVIVQVFVPFW